MEKLETYQRKVGKVLRVRQIIFGLFIVALFGFGLRDILLGRVTIVLAGSCFALSCLVGLALSRSLKIFWNAEKGKVVGQLDLVGALMLVAYFVVEIERVRFFGHWLQGQELTAASLVCLTGLLCGRFLGTYFRINRELVERAD